MSAKDRTTGGRRSTAPAWGTAPGAEGAGGSAPEASPGAGETEGAGSATAPATAPALPTRATTRWWRPGLPTVVAGAGALLVVAVLVTEVVTARRGWAHVGAFYPLAALVLIAFGAVRWRRGTRGVQDATRALVALLSGAVVLTTWVTVDVLPVPGSLHSRVTTLHGYPLGRSSDDSVGVRAVVSDRVWFGESVRYTDGLVLSVSAPQGYTPTEHASTSPHDHPSHVRFRVRLTNGTGDAVDPMELDVQPVSGGLVARKTYDYAPDTLLDRPESVASGTTAEWDLVYNVYDPQDVTVAVAPTWARYDPAVFSR